MKTPFRNKFTRAAVTVVSSLSIAMGSACAIAGDYKTGGYKTVGHKKSHYSDHAYVTDVQPIYRTVRVNEPREECWSEEVYHAGNNSNDNTAGSTIVGGIIGGVIGHQIGRKVNRGRGKHGGTVLGTLIGAAIANENASRKHSSGNAGYTTVENRCKSVNTYHTEERIDAYRVSYKYNGEIFHTRMKHHPGDKIRIKVSVTPSAY